MLKDTVLDVIFLYTKKLFKKPQAVFAVNIHIVFLIQALDFEFFTCTGMPVRFLAKRVTTQKQLP
jgi:hypothetical protein